MPTPPPRDVAVLLDMENLFGGHRQDVTSVPVRELIRGAGEFVRRPAPASDSLGRILP